MIHRPLGLDIQALDGVSSAARIVRAAQIDLAMEHRVTVEDAARRARLIVARAHDRARAIETGARRRAGLVTVRSVTHATDDAVRRALQWLVDTRCYEQRLLAAMRAQLCEWAEVALREIVSGQDTAALIAAPIDARLAQAVHVTDWQLRVAPAMLREISARLARASLQCIADERLGEGEALLQSGALILHIDLARHLEQVIGAMRDAMHCADPTVDGAAPSVAACSNAAVDTTSSAHSAAAGKDQ